MLPTGTIGEARIAGSRLYSGRNPSRVPTTEPGHRSRTARPVGSSGRRPRSRRSMTAGHVRHPFHDHRARCCADQCVGSRQQQFDLAAERLGLDPGMRLVLREPRREFTCPLPGPHGRRVGPGLHRLSRPAQPGARSGQGRHPLPPGRQPRRGQGPGDVDDLEVRRGRHPLRRRQGRRHRRSQEAVEEGAGGPDPALLHRDRGPDRAREGHPGPRRQHQRPGHGLDDGHVLHARRLHRPRGGHGQADQPGRL